MTEEAQLLPLFTACGLFDVGVTAGMYKEEVGMEKLVRALDPRSRLAAESYALAASSAMSNVPSQCLHRPILSRISADHLPNGFFRTSRKFFICPAPLPLLLSPPLCPPADSSATVSRRFEQLPFFSADLVMLLWPSSFDLLPKRTCHPFLPEQARFPATWWGGGRIRSRSGWCCCCWVFGGERLRWMALAAAVPA